MNKALLCLIAILAVAGCSKPEEEDATPAPHSSSTPKAITPVATPKPGAWMRDDAKVTPKGTPKAVNSLGISDDPFAQKPKK